MQTRIIMAIAGAIVLLIGGGLWWWKSSQAPVAPAPVSTPAETPGKPPEDADVPSTPGVQRPVLPSLGSSDEYVRDQVSLLSPGMADWLKQDDLVRRFAVVIDNARTGDYPRRQIVFLTPTAKFPVRQEGDRMLLDPEGYHRFDSFVDTAISIDPQRAVSLVRTLSPLLVEALKELGAKNPDPNVAIRESIEQVLATPDLEGDVEVVQPKVYYQFADPNLEALKPLQKQLLRMGPQNLARIKSYLTQVKGFL
jgi:DUF3014 family protein